MSGGRDPWSDTLNEFSLDCTPWAGDREPAIPAPVTAVPEVWGTTAPRPAGPLGGTVPFGTTAATGGAFTRPTRWHPPDVPGRPARSRAARRRVPEFPLAYLGPMRVTTAYVHTPAGRFPLGEVRWRVRHRFTAVQEQPEWAFISALVGIPFTLGLSLLLLLVKETRLNGYVKVTATFRGRRCDARLPVSDHEHVRAIWASVDLARRWAPAAFGPGPTMAA